MFRKLKRVWSRNDFSEIPNFTKVFPELRNIDHDELCDRWKSLGVTLYTTELVPVKWWLRLTLPFALLLIVILFSFLPIVFLITGNWHYNVSSKALLYNWFKSLRLLKYY